MQEQQNEKNALLVENQYLRNIIDRAVFTKKRMSQEATIMQKAIQLLNIQASVPRQSVENDLVRAVEKLNQLHNQAEESINYFSGLEKEVLSLRLGVSGLTEEREKYMTALKDMKELAKELGKESKEAYAQKEAIRVELEKCNVEKLELTDSQKEIEKEFHSLKLDYENKMQQMKTDFSDYVSINRKQKDSLLQISLELENMRLKVKEYEEKLTATANELEKVKSERDSSVQSANNLKLQLQEITTNKELLTSSTQELQAKISQSDEELSKTKKSLNQALDDLKNEKDKLQKLSKEKKEKEDQNKRLIELCNKLEQKNRLQQEANEVLEEERLKHEHNLQRMNVLLEKSRDENYSHQTLEERETEKDITIRHLREQLSLYEDELKIMKERLDENYRDLSDEETNTTFHTKEEKLADPKQIKGVKPTKRVLKEDHIEKNFKVNSKPPLLHKHSSSISEGAKKAKSPALKREPTSERYNDLVKKLMLVSGESTTKKTPHKSFI
eukprot:TRINITY_DN2779_c0_g1_i5.p1 TRINITY_DN2779_c0_g1~~TRINITY_DN2779_c0_g1_i5.p1  ORF type:complete len:501 (+),score=126.25 TRINITY_DN2779_c0_g1_i5:192-1694(+)